jgi:hypothetical protein
MKYCHSNNGNAPIDVTESPNAASNISNPQIADFINFGWLIYTPSDLPNIKTSQWAIINSTYSEVEVVQYTEEELIAQELVRQEAERLEQERIAAEQERLDNMPFEVSRMKLFEFFDSIGAGDNFIAFIKSTPKIEFMWFSSTVLDSNHPVVVAAMDSITPMLPEGFTAQDLLRQCRAR